MRFFPKGVTPRPYTSDYYEAMSLNIFKEILNGVKEIHENGMRYLIYLRYIYIYIYIYIYACNNIFTT